MKPNHIEEACRGASPAGRRNVSIQVPARHATALLGAAAFLLLTVELLRGAHLAGGAPWSPAMLELGLVQTGLTLLWSLLGVIGWVLGS